KSGGMRGAAANLLVDTHIDIVFDTALVELLAARALEAGRLYRVDRHDIEPNVPVDAPLESQMGYCALHHLRVHTRWGSVPVDRRGRQVAHADDIVDGAAIRLGTGWHVRESAGEGKPFRWAGGLVTLTADPLAAGLRGELVVHLDLESNPYDSSSSVDIAIDAGGATVKTVRVVGRIRVSMPLEPGSHLCLQEIRLRAQEPSGWRRQLPMFERRDEMFYRVYSAVLTETASPPQLIDYPLERWQNANPEAEQSL